MDEENLTMLKPQENAEAELWLQREKMRKMWQTWQEGVESVIDKNSALQSFSNKKTRNSKESPTQCNGKTLGFYTFMLIAIAE